LGEAPVKVATLPIYMGWSIRSKLKETENIVLH
jgi:hypothetical protein